MIQLSDIPWMVTAGVLGFVVESAMVFLSLYTFPSIWLFWLKVIGIYSCALGYTSFHCNRSWPGFLLGALVGLAYESINRYVYPVQIWESSLAENFPAMVITAMVLFALVPWLVDRIVNPWLLRGRFRWLASHHPKYASLKE